MTLQELQKQAMQLSIGDRWQVVQTLLKSLKLDTQPKLQRGNLLWIRGIAKSLAAIDEVRWLGRRHQSIKRLVRNLIAQIKLWVGRIEPLEQQDWGS